MAANWLPSIYWIISQKFIHVPVEVLLITPPFTQLNTPYPATAYLKGFFNRKGIASAQADLGIEVILELFSNRGLEKLFAAIAKNGTEWNDNINRILGLMNEYLQTIDATISFMQGKNPSLAHRIAARNFLPEAGRFGQLQELEWAFGSMGVQDKAKHIATLYLEDLADLIRETIDPYFGFSRYAERLGRSAATFTELNEALSKPTGLVDGILLEKLDEHLQHHQPKLVAISVPFPGNLFAAFRVAQWIRKNHPHIKTAMGGGFPNTELRSLSDPTVFDFFDFITLDDGEAPLEILLQYIKGEVGADSLKRCFLRRDYEVVYLDSSTCKDYRQSEVGVPDYEGLPIHHYISALEIANPMHRLWSDGRWNKLTMAHGCYWGKCTFCDISLDYIQRYEPLTAALLCDKMEEMIRQTGENGFHFVDEAAPPSLMKELAIELINRKIVVSWWANIRFEKSFSRDLCLLLKASGCIAVSGGLEVASDRLLALIQKGITVAQVARVARNFTEAGIMVHAYLMYGFPTQTPQETIDSLEMIRQLFKAGVLQSAFWHLFTMTAHSPVGLEPSKFGVKRLTDTVGSFANNDLVHEDPQGDQERFGEGLRKSLFNYMHGLGLEEQLGKWFEFKVPKTNVAPDQMLRYLGEEELPASKPTTKILWKGRLMAEQPFTQTKKGNSREMISLKLVSKTAQLDISLPLLPGQWLAAQMRQLELSPLGWVSYQQLKEDYEQQGWDDFELFMDNKPVAALYKLGWWRV